jgi:hypothetical protein
MKMILSISVVLFFNGCAVKNVKSWEKGLLAKESMKEGGGNTLFKKYVSHIYFSKEASKGGGGVAGGGCGCN